MAEEIRLQVTLNQDLLPQGQANVPIIARLDLEPDERFRQQHPQVPTDICLLLDSSGSMDEPFTRGDSATKRDGVIAAAQQILPHLGAKDTVSIIFYDSQAHLIAERLPSRRGAEIAALLETLRKYNGATNFEAGLQMAQAVLSNGTAGSRRIFFLTDGNPTHGNAGNTLKLVESLGQAGVTIDCMGVGADFNFGYMRQLSAQSNGRTERLDTRDRAGSLFEQLLVSAQRTIASNVFLNLQFAPGLRDLEVYQTAPETRYFSQLKPGSGGRFALEIPVRTLRQDKRNIYLLKANLDIPTTGHQQPFAEVRLDYDLPPAGLTGQRAALSIAVSCRDQGQPMRDTSIDDMFAEAELDKFYEHFIAIRRQDWQQAVAILDEMTRRAHIIDDQDRLRHYRSLRDKLQQQHGLSDDDLNRLGASSTKSTIAQEAAELGAAGASRLLNTDY